MKMLVKHRNFIQKSKFCRRTEIPIKGSKVSSNKSPNHVQIEFCFLEAAKNYLKLVYSWKYHIFIYLNLNFKGIF